MLGSPLSVFLALRGIRPIGKGSQDHILPRALCSRLYNIYHPSDPVVMYILMHCYMNLVSSNSGVA